MVWESSNSWRSLSRYSAFSSSVSLLWFLPADRSMSGGEADWPLPVPVPVPVPVRHRAAAKAGQPRHAAPVHALMLCASISQRYKLARRGQSLCCRPLLDLACWSRTPLDTSGQEKRQGKRLGRGDQHQAASQPARRDYQII